MFHLKLRGLHVQQRVLLSSVFLNLWLNTDVHSNRSGEWMPMVSSEVLHFLGNCIVQHHVTSQFLWVHTIFCSLYFSFSCFLINLLNLSYDLPFQGQMYTCSFRFMYFPSNIGKIYYSNKQRCVIQSVSLRKINSSNYYY